jgi:poly(3-hydroxybutyrate) depolymerase
MKQGPLRSARPTAKPWPLIVFQGDQDATVSPANAAALISNGLAAGPAVRGQVPGGRAYTQTCYQDSTGAIVAECWMVHQGGHTWSGGAPGQSYTDPAGPDASAELIRFFAEHPATMPAR